jgi:acyl carrier protein
VTAFTKESVWNIIIEQLQQLMLDQDQELGEVTTATMMNADLGIPSIDVIHLMVGLEDRFQRQLDFDELASTSEGTFREDISLGELLDFVYRKVSLDAPHLAGSSH